MYKYLLFLLHFIISSACTSVPTYNDIQTIQDVHQLEGKEVTVTGIYEEAIINQHRQNIEHMGHYQVRINDSLAVLLLPPYEKESKRPDEEVSRLKGKKVKIIGTISAKTNMSRPSMENQPLTVSIPCFLDIKNIQLAE